MEEEAKLFVKLTAVKVVFTVAVMKVGLVVDAGVGVVVGTGANPIKIFTPKDKFASVS